MPNRDLLRQATARVVTRYREKLGEKGRPLSYIQFAWQLTEYVRSAGLKVSYQAIKFWADGVHSPDYLLVLQLFQMSPKGSWQNSFAQEILFEYHKML